MRFRLGYSPMNSNNRRRKCSWKRWYALLLFVRDETDSHLMRQNEWIADILYIQRTECICVVYADNVYVSVLWSVVARRVHRTEPTKLWRPSSSIPIIFAMCMSKTNWGFGFTETEHTTDTQYWERWHRTLVYRRQQRMISDGSSEYYALHIIHKTLSYGPCISVNPSPNGNKYSPNKK